MSQAYTPGLKVTGRTTLRVRRVLSIAGRVTARKGEQVRAEDVVAETEIPGNIFPINLANSLSVSPADVPAALTVPVGEKVEAGDVIAISKGFFGWFRKEYRSKVTGTIESASKITGQVILRGEPIPVQVKAFVAGEVVEVVPEYGVLIESQVSLIQGIFGIGGEAYGPIRIASHDVHAPLTADHLQDDMQGQIVVGGARMTAEAIQKAIELKVAAVVSGGIDDQDLRDILGYDLGVAITGTEKIGTTLMITEGFGDIAMAQRTHDLFCQREGLQAAVNGATQIRAGVMRPEVVIPLQDYHEDINEVVEGGAVAAVLEPGVMVRLIRDPYFGKIGKVIDLPHEPQMLESGSKARVLTVACNSEEQFVVPRANVEIIAE